MHQSSQSSSAAAEALLNSNVSLESFSLTSQGKGEGEGGVGGVSLVPVSPSNSNSHPSVPSNESLNFSQIQLFLSSLPSRISSVLHSSGLTDSSLPIAQRLKTIILSFPTWASHNPRPIVYFITGSCIISLFTGHGGRRISNLVGLIYPLYATIKALRTSSTEDDTHWLTYWLVYSLVHNLDYVTEFIGRIIPLFHIVKLIFYIWCFLPQTKGASLIYRKLIAPAMEKYEGAIDTELSQLKQAASSIVQEQVTRVETGLGNEIDSAIDTVVTQTLKTVHDIEKSGTLINSQTGQSGLGADEKEKVGTDGSHA